MTILDAVTPTTDAIALDDRYAAHGRPSFKRLLAEIHNAWIQRRDRITEIGKSVTEYLQQMGDATASDIAVTPERLSRPGP